MPTNKGRAMWTDLINGWGEQQARLAASLDRADPRYHASDADRHSGEWRRDFADVVTGAACDFWPTNGWKTAGDSPRYDVEQQIAITLAVMRACSLPVASAEQRWRVVEAAVADLAFQYAEHRADERVRNGGTR